MYSFHLFLISLASTRSLPFLSSIVPVFGQNASLMFPVFLKRSLVFSFLLFSSIIKHCSLKKVLLYLLVLFWNSVFNFIYLSLTPLLFASLLSSAICKASPDKLCLLDFLFLWNGFVCSSGTLLIRSSPLNLFVTSTANSYGIWFKSCLAGLLFFPVFFHLSLNFAMRSW